LALKQERTAGQGSCVVAAKRKAAPCYNRNALQGGLQLAAMRTMREGPRHRDPQGGSSEGTQRGDGRRPGRRPLQKTDGSRGGGRYMKRRAAQQAAVTEMGRLSRRPSFVQKAGGRYRRPSYEKRTAVAGGRCRRPLQGQCPGAGCPSSAVKLTCDTPHNANACASR
jgi:hypothetical protein